MVIINKNLKMKEVNKMGETRIYLAIAVTWIVIAFTVASASTVIISTGFGELTQELVLQNQK